ncbi:MAG TPA: formate dehydrogenase accessory sulfurtransferase FdhD [Elusimicrobiales bacterium]|nr:formate dehydrogenase accessory sulfurtransferase FdhD [Elusimicrobiales bacterium]
MIEKFNITKVTEGKKEIVEDFIVKEIPLTINVNKKELATLLCSPNDLEVLAKGFLFTSGLIKGGGDIKSIYTDTQKWTCDIELAQDLDTNLISKRLYTSGCGKGTIFYSSVDLMYKRKLISDLKIKASQIPPLMLDFYKKSEVFLKTGGVHSAALGLGDNIVIFKEDIGRHNAVDKVIGQALNDNIKLEDKFLITSGRISSEVVFKARKTNIAIVISRGAPTNQAVRHGRSMDITIIGFARGNKLNIYSGVERIIV